MKKFRFRLQRVLDYRETLTKEKERELAQRNFELQEQERRVEEIMAAQDGQLLEEPRVMTMAELTGRGDYLASLQEALVHQRLQVIEAAEAVEKARQAYIEKAIEEETLEKLKDRRLSQYKEDVHRYERKQMDNVVVQRYRFTKKGIGQEES